MNLNTLRAHIAKRGGFAYIESSEPSQRLPRLAERPDESIVERPSILSLRRLGSVFQRIDGRTYLVPVYAR